MGHTTRRHFLKQAAALAAPALVPGTVRGGPGRDAPSERVAVGSIGVGGRGRLNTRGLMAHGAQVVAVCDVNAGHRAHARREVQAGSWYFISDYAASGFVAGWGVHHVDMPNGRATPTAPARWKSRGEASCPTTASTTRR